MKIFLTILISLCSSILFAQSIVNRAGNANTVADGRHQSTLNDFLPRYQDTTTANLPANIGIDSCGALIYNRATNSLWYRACNPKRWLPVESGGGAIHVFMIAGQSNAVGNSGSPSTALVPEAGTAFQFYNNSISAAVEPIGNSNGSAWGAFAMTYYKLTGVKICFVPAAVNGSSMASAAQVGFGTWDTTGTLYNTSLLRADSAMSALAAAGYTPIFKGILWCQGETDGDGINRGNITQNIYSAAFAKLIKNYRLEFGKGIAFNISRTGFRTDTIQTGYLAVQAAQVALANPDSLTNITYWNAPFFPQRSLMVDIYHYRQAGYNEMGRVMAEEFINSTSNNLQQQAGNLYYKLGNLGVGDIIPTSPVHIYKTGTGAEIKIYDSLATAVRIDIENKVDNSVSSSAVWFRTAQGLRSQIGSAPSSSISGGDISFFNSTPGLAINSDSGDVNISTGVGTSNLPAKGRIRVKNDGDIGIGAAVDPVASALVEMVSTTKGLLIPRMTAVQRIAILSPATGLLVYDLDSAKHCYYTGAAWVCYGSGSGAASSWNASMAVSADLNNNYTSDFNGNSWNIQSFDDITLHSDAGVTTRLKLNSSTSNLFAPNGSAGFRITNDTTFIKGTTQADLSSEGQAVVWNNTDYIQLYSGTAAGVSLGNGGFFELTQVSSVITSTVANGTRVASYGGVADLDSTTQVTLIAQSEGEDDQIIVGFDPNSTTKRGIHLFSGGDSVFIRYGWGPPSTPSLTGYALQARNTTTGSLVDFTGSISTTWNGITNPTGDQVLTFDAGEGTVWTNSNTTEDLLTVNSSTVTTSSFFSLNRTSTALAAGNNMMELISSGANGSSSITATGLSISVTNTGTSSTNTAARLVASGGTNNYALSTSGTTLVNDFDIAASGLSTTPAMAIRSTTNDIEGGLIIANNANYVNIAKITAMRMQFTQDLQLDVLGGDFHINSSQTSFGFGVDPTAKIHIGASSTAAGSGQIKFAEGTALTTPEDGTLNYVSNNLQFTETSTVYILAKTLTNTAILDFGSTAAGTSTDLTVSLTGAAVGDAVVIGVDNAAMPDNGVFFGWVSATNTVSIRYANNDLTNAKDPASATFRVSVLKY